MRCALPALRKLALVTPYLADVQAAIIANLTREGFEVTAERHLEDPGNYSFALHDAAKVGALMEEAVAERPTDAVVIHCTNFRGLPAARELETHTMASWLWIPWPPRSGVASGRRAGRNPGARIVLFFDSSKCRINSIFFD
jgi:hypothetical protein